MSRDGVGHPGRHLEVGAKFSQPPGQENHFFDRLSRIFETATSPRLVEDDAGTGREVHSIYPFD
jgi:hypothetical protein